MYQQVILKSLILNPISVKQMGEIDRLKSYVFVDDVWCGVFDLLYSYMLKYDSNVTVGYLRDYLSLECGDSGKILSVLDDDSVELVQDVMSYVDLQVTSVVRNRSLLISQEFERKLKTTGVDGIRGLVYDFNESVSNMIRGMESGGRTERLLYGDSAVDEVLSRHRKKKDESDYICRFGISELDRVWYGLKKDSFITIGAYAKQGKSTMLRQLCYNMLLQGVNILFLTLEMSIDSVEDMFYVLHANNNEKFGFEFPNITVSRLEQGLLSEDEERFMSDVVIPDFMNNDSYGSLYLLQPNDYSYDKSRFFGDVLSIHKTVMPLHAIFIDYITLIKPKVGKTTTREDMNEMIAEVRRFSLSHGIPVVTAGQIKREAFNNAVKDKENLYGSDCLSDYNEFERASTGIMTVLQTPEMYATGTVQVQNTLSRETKPFDTFRMVRRSNTGWHASGITSKERKQEVLDAIIENGL